LKRRIDLGLSLKSVAMLLDVTVQTIRSWENDKGIPRIQQHKSITAFLGYSLWQVDTSTLSGRIREYRHRQGLSAKKLAELVGVSETAIFKWEFKKTKPPSQLEATLASLLENTKPLE
jgi:transcriptional regulator with XRE-family HTH domain